MERAKERRHAGRFQSEASGMEPPTKRRRNGASQGAAEGRDAKNGAEAQSRTGDTSIFSAVLYQLSYLGTARPRGQNPHNIRSKTPPPENACTRDRVLVPSASTEKTTNKESACTRDRDLVLSAKEPPKAATLKIAMVRPAPTPSQKAETSPAIPRRRAPRTRFWLHAMAFAACVLLVNGLFGERGLMDTIRARRAQSTAARDLDRLKRENDALRDQARRLRNDPAAIEAVARGELGLMRPGEILVTIKDVK